MDSAHRQARPQGGVRISWQLGRALARPKRLRWISEARSIAEKMLRQEATLHATSDYPGSHSQGWELRFVSKREKVGSPIHFGISPQKLTQILSIDAIPLTTGMCHDRTMHCNKHDLFYSITSSVATSRPGGTVRPRAFAVFMLTTVSYLVGTCTGRSAGLAPRRMRSIQKNQVSVFHLFQSSSAPRFAAGAFGFLLS